MSSMESAAISHYEDEVFPLSFSNAGFELPTLSHSPDRSTYADEFSQSYQQELLTSPLSYPIADELEYTYAKNKTSGNVITSAEDDFIFDMEFGGSAVAARRRRPLKNLQLLPALPPPVTMPSPTSPNRTTDYGCRRYDALPRLFSRPNPRIAYNTNLIRHPPQAYS